MGQLDELLAQVMQPMLGLASRPDARDRRQVVRAERRDRVVRPGRGLRALEPDEPVGERADLFQLPAHHGLDEAEVLADDEGAGAAAFPRKQAQKDPGRVPDVGALGSGHPVGDPEEPEQAHHVVEPDAGGVPARAADRVDERSPVSLAQLPRVQRGQAPVLAVAEELIRSLAGQAEMHRPLREQVDDLGSGVIGHPHGGKPGDPSAVVARSARARASWRSR